MFKDNTVTVARTGPLQTDLLCEAVLILLLLNTDKLDLVLLEYAFCSHIDFVM